MSRPNKSVKSSGKSRRQGTNPRTSQPTNQGPDSRTSTTSVRGTTSTPTVGQEETATTLADLLAVAFTPQASRVTNLQEAGSETTTPEPWTIASPRRNRTRDSLSPSALELDSALDTYSPGNISIPAGSGSLVLNASIPEINAGVIPLTPSHLPQRATIWSPAHNKFVTVTITTSDTNPDTQESANTDDQETLEATTEDQAAAEDLSSEEEEEKSEEQGTSEIDSHEQTLSTLNITPTDISDAYVQEQISEARYRNLDDPNPTTEYRSRATGLPEPSQAAPRNWQRQTRTELASLPTFQRRVPSEANVPYVFRYQRQENVETNESTTSAASDRTSETQRDPSRNPQ
jgi:hypothetical protein